MLVGRPEALARVPTAEWPSPDLFLESAVFRWMALPISDSALSVIRELADNLAQRHDDMWLQRAIVEVPSGDPLWTELRAAVEANAAETRIRPSGSHQTR